MSIRTALIAFMAIFTFSLPASAQTIAVKDGKIWTGTDAGIINNGTLVVREGVITAIGGPGTPIPANARIIEASGNWVTPGIIASFTRIGLVEIGAEDSTNDTSSGGSDYSTALNAADSFNPAATSIDVTRIEGVTRIAVAPSPTSNLFAGQGFIADTSGKPRSITQDKAFQFLTLGESGASHAGGSRSAAWAQLRAALGDARTYPSRYLANPQGDALNRLDAKAFGPAARGQQLILIEARRASDLRAIIDFAASEPALKIAIVGADEGWLLADELGQSGIPVIIDPFSNLPESFEQLAATSHNAERLIKAGVEVAFAHLGDDGHQARLALQVAGNAVATGVDHDAALRALTVIPARIFGLDGYGELQRGAYSDVVVWDGDPLEITSSPDAIIINGELQSLESRQTRLRDRYLSSDESDRPFAYKH